jgi:hypothetical protein
MTKIISFFYHFTRVLFFILFISCSKESPIEPKIDDQKLNDAFSLARQISNLKSLVVSSNGTIIKEMYLGTGGADSIHDVRSVTKSFTSLLIGLAIDKGYIKDVYEPIGKYLDEFVKFQDSIKANITIDQILKMSFGHVWNGTKDNSLYNTWALAPDHLQFIIDLPLVWEPGTVFNYSDGASHLLSVIVTIATGKNTLDFAKENLFDPLEIKNFKWSKDDKGFPNGAAGLSISPHDMIKFGNLILNKGKYNGRQIIPESWINTMTTTKISTNSDIPYGPDYGYQIWIGSTDGHKYIFAMGWGGQFIVIVPDFNLVVAATNEWSGISSTTAGDQWYRTIDLIMTLILPAFKS